MFRAIEARLPFGLGQRIRLEHAATQFAEGTDSLRVPRLWVPLLGWTAVTTDGSMAAHFEDTIAITEDGPDVLTRAAI